MSRRATLRGAALLGSGAMLGGGAAVAGMPLRVGVVAGLGIVPADVEADARREFGRPAVLVAHASWGVLADHAAAGHGIDAAVLPVDARWTGRLVTLANAPEAMLVLAPAADERLAPSAGPPDGLKIGIAVRSSAAATALRGRLGAAVRLVVLEPAALLDSVTAGLLDGAVIVGRAAPARAAGLRTLPLHASLAAAMLPALALVPAGGEAFARA